MEKDVEKPHLEIRYQRMFNHFDKNGDGKISPAELLQCWYAIGMRKLAEDADVLVASLDTDGDGLLRFDHFVKLMEGENEQDRLNDLEEAIEMYDMDDFVLLDSKFCWCRTLHRLVGNFKATLVRSNRKTNRGTNLIPVSRKDLKNIALKQKLMFCTTIGKMLVLPLVPGTQIFLVLLLLSAPLLYFPELMHRASASGVEVACGGSFTLPLIGFTTLAAISICLIFVVLALLVVYLSWRFIHGRIPTRGQDIEVNFDDFSFLTSNG
ncbi:putative calcium-binding protein CML19 [Trifolium repens]|nr:putative calcium-binding protein CML19 [Trifolium repens]